MARMLKVQAQTTFNGHARGDVLLVEEDAEVKKLVKGRYFVVLDVVKPDAPAEKAPAKKATTTKKSTKKAADVQ